MNKELTPLEALKEVREKTDAGFIYDYHNKEPNPLNIVEKALKALEIIKENFVFLEPAWIAVDSDEMAYGAFTQNKHLTKEEFDLLKEVLL